MKLNYGGFVELSMSDWPGKPACVVFFRGCPLLCPNCHNAGLRTGLTLNPLDQIKAQIKGVQPFIKHVVFSGGEPLKQPKALEYLAQDLGMFRAIHTSGCSPATLESLIGSHLVDTVFLDIKAPFYDDLYYKATGIEDMKDRAFISLVSCIEMGVPTIARITLFDNLFDQALLIDMADTIRDILDGCPNNQFQGIILQAGRKGKEVFSSKILADFNFILDGFKLRYV
jgi:pyruvate formate lyase activating enzyme